jgi:putative transposase
MARSSGAPMSWTLGHSFGPLAVMPSIPNDEAIVRLEGAFLLEQNDEWGLQRARYVTLETIAPMGDDPIISLPSAAP